MEDFNSATNYYEVLEVPTDAGPDEIHHGYIRAKNAYSQDSLALYSLMSQDECQKMVEKIEEAYHIISDPVKRKLYDEAKGLNQHLKCDSTLHSNKMINTPPSSTHQEANAQELGINETSHKIQKIVASKKFSLDYKINQEFEDEIEKASEYTGEFLQKIREYKNVDILRMSEMTKVSKTYIRFIEEETYDKLPALVYVRGFVYQIAKCLKLNPDLVANSYLARAKKIKES
ncbi:MAG: helix-turn-helix domain-containing protein [Halobacteriovoraceae bacterium]|nr:helix-turn-helix domain-containing protein [Halobacteriovoraceae bacterium]